jgi:hypothetical protein
MNVGACVGVCADGGLGCEVVRPAQLSACHTLSLLHAQPFTNDTSPPPTNMAAAAAAAGAAGAAAAPADAQWDLTTLHPLADFDASLEEKTRFQYMVRLEWEECGGGGKAVMVVQH